MGFLNLRRKIRVLNRRSREVRMVANALKSPRHPILAHMIPIRRCNLACTYCNEFDSVSAPVPTEEMFARIDRLAALGTAVITLSGGEPLLHPDVVQIIRHIRNRGSIAELITNGYLLTVARIKELNTAGLDHLQISIDNVEPDEVSKKSLKVLDKKLQMLAEHAEFDVNINSVIGGAMANPDDALVINGRAKELGLTATVGIIHNHQGQLQPLGPREQSVYDELTAGANTRFFNFERYNSFQSNLSRGLPNDWQCRAGSRYLYICEDGLVHWCSQQRGFPGISIHEYTQQHLDREYTSIKPCALYCTISCVHRVSVVDQFRQDPHGSLIRFFPPKSGEKEPDLPFAVRALRWMFLPPQGSRHPRWIGRTFLRLLRVR
jgi:MoaA/NifB/PqqE/SkfB family radical SAM enzyme